MNTALFLLIGLCWLVAGLVNISNHAPWQSIVFDFVACAVFVLIGFVKAIRSGDSSGKKKK